MCCPHCEKYLGVELCPFERADPMYDDKPSGSINAEGFLTA